MANRRRWLRFSLRSLLVVLTVFAAWLVIVGHRARKQAEVVAAIKAMGGAVVYDWQVDASADLWLRVDAKPTDSLWLRKLARDEYIYDVVGVDFVLTQSILTPGGQVTSTPEDIVNLIPQFRELPALTYVSLSGLKHKSIWKEMANALPNAKIRLYFPR